RLRAPALSATKIGGTQWPPDPTKEPTVPVHRRRRLTPPLRAQHHPDDAAHARRSRLKVPQIQALAADGLTQSRGQNWTPIGGQLCVPFDSLLPLRSQRQ